jgi:hypothetical protein
LTAGRKCAALSQTLLNFQIANDFFRRVEFMKKAKAKAKANSRTKNAGTGTSAAVKNSGENIQDVNPAEVRRDIANIVGNAAREITRAVVVEAKKGQLATAKYLFEAAGFYPAAAAEENTDKPEEDTLAQRVLRRLGLPEGPLPDSGDDDPPVKLMIPLAQSVVPVSGGMAAGQEEPVEKSGAEKDDSGDLVVSSE